MRTALIQLNGSDDPTENTNRTLESIDEAVASGAEFVLTPEVTNCISASRPHQRKVLCYQDGDPTLAAMREKAASSSVWLLVGSLALRTDDADGRFANRSFLISPDGSVEAWYDKIHMFDVSISNTEFYRESSGYRPGERAVVAGTPLGKIGLTICYDIRFPGLYRQLAQLGAEILTVPSAFSTVTGAAHWDSLLRARAIETGAFVLAPAQTGRHQARRGRSRETYGHSMVVDPWGSVLADALTDPGVIIVDLDLAEVSKARNRIPSLTGAARFQGP